MVCRRLTSGQTGPFETLKRLLDAIMEDMRLLRSHSFRTGLVLLGVATILWLGLEWSASYEQAPTPGEKNLGVAVLGVLFGIATVIFAVGGAVCVIASLVSTYLRVSPRNQIELLPFFASPPARRLSWFSNTSAKRLLFPARS